MKIGIGQPRSGKTESLLKEISSSTKKKIVFDFNEDFKNLDGARYDFEEFHPLIDALDIDEVAVLNAGYLKYSHCLYRKAEDIYAFEGQEKIQGIVREAIDRLHASWDKTENDNAKDLVERIPLKINSKQRGFTTLMEIIEENDVIILTAKNIFSDHLRSLIYLLLYKIEQNGIDVEIYADGISNMFFKGNVRLLSKKVDLENMNIIFNSNKPRNIPKEMYPLVSEWRLFRITDKSELNFVEKNIFKSKTKAEKIPLGKFDAFPQIS